MPKIFKQNKFALFGANILIIAIWVYLSSIAINLIIADDAPFYFIDNNQGQAVFINADSQGHALIFPGTLIHTVYPKETEDVRISVSGNVILDVDKT